jgi:hypothetical protein
VTLNIISSLFLETNAQHSGRTGTDYCCLGTNGIEKREIKGEKNTFSCNL